MNWIPTYTGMINKKAGITKRTASVANEKVGMIFSFYVATMKRSSEIKSCYTKASGDFKVTIVNSKFNFDDKLTLLLIRIYTMLYTNF